MMKFKTGVHGAKNFISGFITCAVLFSLVMSVNAWVGTRQATLVYDDITVTIDGKPVTLTDLEGRAIEPMMIDQTIYVPMSPLVRQFGYTSVYEAVNKRLVIAKITETPVVQQPKSTTPNVWLDEMDHLNSQGDFGCKWEKYSGKDSVGNSYTHGILYKMMTSYRDNSQYTEYLLNAKYKNFKGKFSLSYDSRSATDEGKLIVFGDDKILYETTIKAGVLPKEFDINVTGVKILRIQTDKISKGGYAGINLCIVDAGFYE